MTDDVVKNLQDEIKEVRGAIVGRWTFTIIMGIFMAINGFFWYEVRELKGQVTVQMSSIVRTNDEKRDVILDKIADLSNQVNQLRGALDAHMLMTPFKK